MKRAVLFVALAMGCAASENEDGRTGGDAGEDVADTSVDASVGDTSLDAFVADTFVADTFVADTSAADAGSADTGSADTGSADTGASDTGASDTGSADTGASDTGASADTSTKDTGPTGPLSGGPCASGAAGVTAFRLKFTNSGGHAMTNYEVIGLPDKTGLKATAYKTGSIDPSWYPPYDDMFLEVGGLRLDGSDFLDINFSESGISSIAKATIWIYGRSFNTTASGSFTWQTLKGVGASDTMANSTPYAWYPGVATTEFTAGKSTDLLRIKAGGPSGAIIVSRIEVCMDAL